MVNPKACHRFVGYLEQTACETYKNIIDHAETPGTELHAHWHALPAPEIAKGYWKLMGGRQAHPHSMRQRLSQSQRAWRD